MPMVRYSDGGGSGKTNSKIVTWQKPKNNVVNKFMSYIGQNWSAFGTSNKKPIVTGNEPIRKPNPFEKPKPNTQLGAWTQNVPQNQINQAAVNKWISPWAPMAQASLPEYYKAQPDNWAKSFQGKVWPGGPQTKPDPFAQRWQNNLSAAQKGYIDRYVKNWQWNQRDDRRFFTRLGYTGGAGPQQPQETAQAGGGGYGYPEDWGSYSGGGGGGGSAYLPEWYVNMTTWRI